MGGNDSNFRFSERTLPLAQAVISQMMCERAIKIRALDNTEFGGIQVSDFEDDLRHNSDLHFAYAAGTIQVGVRIRDNQYIQRYGNQFTIRSRAQYGGRTEIHKILDGFGKFFFYGFANPQATQLCRWFVGDFNVFRQYHFDCSAAGKTAHAFEIDNGDGTRGLAYDLNKLPAHFKVCSWSLGNGFRTYQVPELLW